MKSLFILLLLLAAYALLAGGCTSQPPARAQADFDSTFTLETDMKDGRMVFVGIGGEIDGVVNPDLNVRRGDMVQFVLVNGDGMPHDLAVPELKIHTDVIMTEGDTAEVVAEINQAGQYSYYCTIAGHRQAGMEGNLIVSEP